MARDTEDIKLTAETAASANAPDAGESRAKSVDPFIKKQCKYCASDIPSAAKICPTCKKYQKWYLNFFRVSDVLLFFSLSVSLSMVIFSYLNFHEAREKGLKRVSH